MRTRDRGNAVVEFIGVVIVMAVPMAYAIVGLAQSQSAVQGVHGAAQMALRAYVHANSDLVGRYAAVRAATVAGRNHGLIITASDVEVSCTAPPCLTPGGAVQVRVSSRVLIGAGPLARTVTFTSARSGVVDPFRQVPW